MKRRLSVAISQNGDAKLCLIRTLLPSNVRLFLPHSMEEAEFLCDRLGIMANGSLQCIGNSKEKYVLPKHKVRIANVYRAVEVAKSKFTVSAWGLTDTTVEDVFIKVAKGTQSFDS
ncbi:hypothetical protein FEM48_Zijuj05G0020500 [Ziziphus jujuba var. spinosa]|uniref:Uncharacterized protein n=1 Tax=Ziziphus jujuba var. spinosa TaxID=714518 RepID=A0A978VC62_ZIZJJ|nr:hypothetical protein FEM48_Zijuj05G0020500 [Ziziphus jujuba var. spinosa]